MGSPVRRACRVSSENSPYPDLISALDSASPEKDGGLRRPLSSFSFGLVSLLLHSAEGSLAFSIAEPPQSSRPLLSLPLFYYLFFDLRALQEVFLTLPAQPAQFGIGSIGLLALP